MERTKVRVALVHQSSLLAQAVQAILEADDVPVLGIDLGEDHAAERIRDHEASVVVVDGDDLPFRDCALVGLLEKVPEITLVCVHGGGDHLDVYRKTRVAVHGTHDLATAIGAA